MIELVWLVVLWLIFNRSRRPIPWERHPDKDLIRLAGDKEWMSMSDFAQLPKDPPCPL